MLPASPFSVFSVGTRRLAGLCLQQARLSTARTAALPAVCSPKRFHARAWTPAPGPRPSSRPASTPRRCYHSFDHPSRPPPEDAFTPVEQAVLTAAVRHIPEHGFTAHAIAAGARDAGYPAISAAILPDGVFSLVQWHLVSQRARLAARKQELYGSDAAAAETAPLDAAQIAERAETLTWERLLGNKEIIGRWQEALAIMAQPSYVPASMRELALLSDEIWTLAGDNAVDPSWYTKRAALSTIYAASELSMTTDAGAPDYTATRAFLRRRFQESQDIGGYVRSVGEWVGFTASAGLNVLRSKGLGI